MLKFKLLPGLGKDQVRSARKITIGVTSAVMMLAGGVTSSVASGDVLDEIIRNIECVGLLFTDPELHLVECGVGDVGSFTTLAPGFSTPVMECEYKISANLSSEDCTYED